MDSGGQTVRGVVAQGNDLLLVLELGDGADGAENLLLHDLHVGTNVREDGRLDEVALVTVAVTANLHSGALLLAGLDVAHDAVVLQLADLGALESLGVEGVANLVGLGALLEGIEELVVDALVDEDTRAGAAALAVVEVDAEVDPRDGLLDVGVGEDDVGGLATQLEGDLLQVGGGGGLHDGAANDGGAGEGDLVDVHVGRDGSTGDLAEAGDEVEDTGGEAGLLDEVGEDETRQGRLLGRLHDNGVAGGQGRADLPGKHEQGEVPGNNLTADTNLEDQLATEVQSERARVVTYGLLAGVVEHVGGNVDGLALNLVGPATVVTDAGGNGADIALGHGDGLAVVKGLDGGEQVEVLLDKVGELEKQAAALRGSDLAPCGLESLAGGGDGEIDILLGGLTD